MPAAGSPSSSPMVSRDCCAAPTTRSRGACRSWSRTVTCGPGCPSTTARCGRACRGTTPCECTTRCTPRRGHRVRGRFRACPRPGSAEMMRPGSRGKIRPDGRRFTLVSFHAHPDDESLLTGGTLAKAAAEGHRVVLVTATSGERGLGGPDDGHGADLARARMAELEDAAAALGCARVLSLGYGDSGLHPDPSDSGAFVHVDVASAAARLAEVLREEDAHALTVYDPNGGYGHPDHVQVHRVGVAAARLAGTPVVLEATVSAGLFRSVLVTMRLLGHALGRSAPMGTAQVFS